MSPELVIIDTSAWIFALRKDAFQSIRDRVDALLEKNVVAITPVIKLELLGGTRTEAEFRRLESRLDALTSLEITGAVWKQAAVLAFDLRRQGLTVPYTDILISQTAISNKATIVHADVHYDLIAEKIGGLSVESFVSQLGSC